MADTRLRLKSEVLPIRAEAAQLLLPEEVGSEVKNMYFTEEGTLRSVWGPAPYVPNYGAGYPSYQTMKGIFHARLGQNGERDVLLAQWGDQIRVFEGWNAAAGNAWRALLGPAATSPQREAQFEADKKARFPAQFVSTSNGIVIIPAGGSSRPYFYDGQEILPLGYSSPPGAPIGMGQNEGYAHTYEDLPTDAQWIKNGRIGSLSLDSINTSGDLARVAPGQYRAATQWIDLWGNLSPLSGKSTTVEIKAADENDFPEQTIPQLLWGSISPGPLGTIGRILHRTKDELSSGTLDLFEVPCYAAGGFLSFSTLSDNSTLLFADNTPDSWLIRKPKAVVAVPAFKLYAVAFGRGWAANFEGDPGRLHYTLPGRWGTFEEFAEIYPDPSGNEITGVQAVAEGLLVFTESSTFLVVPNDSGDGFITQTLHSTIGCVAPSSIATLSSGQTVWLGREGFFSHTPVPYGQGTIALISSPIDKHVRGFNKARMLQACAAVDVREGVYRCWVADQASTINNVCWEFDGTGWKRRTDVSAAGVCVTSDHRAMMLVAGSAQESGEAVTQGVWVLDHQVQSWVPQTRTASVQTAWLRSARSKMKGSPLTVYLWLRARESGTLNVEVQRDWKATITQTVTAPLYATEDTPAFWDTAILGTGTWEQARPYWTRVDIFVPSSEVFRLKISHTSEWEFIAIAFDEAPKGDTFRSAPK